MTEIRRRTAAGLGTRCLVCAGGQQSSPGTGSPSTESWPDMGCWVTGAVSYPGKAWGLEGGISLLSFKTQQKQITTLPSPPKNKKTHPKKQLIADQNKARTVAIIPLVEGKNLPTTSSIPTLITMIICYHSI